jgi:hypothetical protein
MFAVLEKAKRNVGNIGTELDSSPSWGPWKNQAGIFASAKLVKAWSAVQGLDWQRSVPSAYLNGCSYWKICERAKKNRVYMRTGPADKEGLNISFPVEAEIY